MPKTKKKAPPGYTYRYEWPDSGYSTHRRRVLVKRPKDARTGEYIYRKKKKSK